MVLLAAALVALPPRLSHSQPGSTVADNNRPEAHFPLQVSANKRYLVDATGKPFLIHGDTAWSLIAQLKRDDVLKYLDDRRARGFNTILVNLLEHRFSSNPPANAYGQVPFLTPGDFSKPNEDYFAYADWILQRAHERGLLVLLAPAYLGVDGGPEGWYQEMSANGIAKLRKFGEFLGSRYRDFQNILWVHGGDYNPPQKELVRAIVDGIRATQPNALHTAHGAPGTAAIEYWTDETWLEVNNIYTYEPVYRVARTQYQRPTPTPFFLIESAYENEHGASELRIRTQAYQALLSGATGHIYGNNPIWHFDGPGIYAAPTSWQNALGSRGAESMTHLRKLFSGLAWWKLIPDTDNVFLLRRYPSSTGMADDIGSGQHRALAAWASDGSFGLAYIPAAHSIVMDLVKLSGPKVAVRWYDPASGEFISITGSPFDGGEKRRFAPPPRNTAGLHDWVLVLESCP